MQIARESPKAGDVLIEVEDYVIHKYWALMFEDAMAEAGVRRPDEDLNPVFAYLVLLDALDLRTFFPSIRPTAVEEGLLNGELEIERRSERGLRFGERYDVIVRLESTEQKHGRTLGDFEIVTLVATITGKDGPCEFVVRNRILFLRGGAESSTAATIGDARPSEFPPYEIAHVSGEGAKLVVALTRDPSPLHWDTDEVRRLGLGEQPLNPGSNNLAYIIQMARISAGGYGRIRRLRARFLSRVQVGDHVVAGGRQNEDGSISAWLERAAASGHEVVVEAKLELTV
jgi:hypothetical protein